MSQVHLELQQSEAVVAQCAATIYATTCPQRQGTSGQVEAGQESAWISRSIREAAELAPCVQGQGTERAIHSDDERRQRDPASYE
jgi:hypothetical protein